MFSKLFISEEEGNDDEFMTEANDMTNFFSASEGFGIVGIGGRYGYINTDGKVVVPLVYTAVTPFLNGVAYVRDENNNWLKIYAKDIK